MRVVLDLFENAFVMRYVTDTLRYSAALFLFATPVLAQLAIMDGDSLKARGASATAYTA